MRVVARAEEKGQAYKEGRRRTAGNPLRISLIFCSPGTARDGSKDDLEQNKEGYKQGRNKKEAEYTAFPAPVRLHPPRS